MNKFVIGLLLGNISAMKLNQASADLPDYWDGNYSNTWKYADKEHIVNETSWLEGNPYGYTEAVFGDGGIKGGDRTDGYKRLQNGASLAQISRRTPDTPDDYNREHAWTQDQHDKSHPKEWTDETAKITQGGYVVATQHKAAFAQKTEEELKKEMGQANKDFRLNYLGALSKGYTESQAKNFAEGERQM